ncbi:glycoside hydrolase family 2 protein [Membranihabitans marinus]|uniref:glycoside hydrolase family 2 protein n=1 Tax=Membranihabitans marinus TaxID=1227546 RepID=UPI001F32E2D4|nr:glycoside hydrolase family 2 TIM barrel-domain containing protein [Membranihabitans marinus]
MWNTRAFIFCIALLQTLQALSQDTEIVYLSGVDADHTKTWDFYCTDGRNSGKWSTIEVPSNWELQGFGTYNYGHDWKDENKKLGQEHGLYKTSFEVPEDWRGKTINIVFDGAMTDTKVEINGVQAGPIHQGGFYRFKYDITDLVKYGSSNLLEVDVAKHSENESVNEAERRADFWIFGGIFRPVFLEVLPGIHMNRAAIHAKAEGEFEALISLNQPAGSYDVEVDLYDVNGKEKLGQGLVFSLKQGEDSHTIEGKFDNVESWNPEHPHLYTMEITLKDGDRVLHVVRERIGFRTVELRKHDGFYVNGQKVVFKGVCRHSFWPETGRCLSDENNRMDVELMKDMNMNAVRMSHYVPDERFLELCDSLGLFVLDEVTGWQDGYDTVVGPQLIAETILKDENHPSVVVWNHGNEGGWDMANEKWFNYYDIQKRPVIYPWLLRNGVDSHHYPEYRYGISRKVAGNDPFMATELLHGLYDGGIGAGLEEYWRNYESSPLLAGGFLWVFSDEAVLRTDLPGKVYDADGNHAPDGILGPHREKEASFYTVKEIWSPVQIDPVTINTKWNGQLILKNKFFYTNLNQCSFTWRALRSDVGSVKKEVVGKGLIKSPNAEPGEAVKVSLNLGNALQKADVFEFTAVDHEGRELYTWSWPVLQPEEKAAQWIQGSKAVESAISKVHVTESQNTLLAKANNVEILLDKNSGKLLTVTNKGKEISFNGGPVSAGISSEIIGHQWSFDETGSFVFQIDREGYPDRVIWKLDVDGLLYMEASGLQQKVIDVEFLGLSFNYPEEKCTGVRWMGKGPYRVWKNRNSSYNMGIFQKAYNNTITGESFNDLLYPEFKGYHGDLYWMTLENTESEFTIVSGTPNLFFQLFTPAAPKLANRNIHPPFPEGDISFLYEIPAIGTKFKNPEKLGPLGHKGFYSKHGGDEFYPIKLWFDFRND